MFLIRQAIFFLTICNLAIGATVSSAETGSASELYEKHRFLNQQMIQSVFKRPLVLESSENGSLLKGDIYGSLHFPLDAVRNVVMQADRWCEVLLLLSNTKRCTVSTMRGKTPMQVVNVYVGGKTPEDLTLTQQISFVFEPLSDTPEFLKLSLTAKEGPLGTSDYRIDLGVVEVSGPTTFVHLSYAYSSNLFGRLTMQTYLQTVGRGKVGFSVKAPVGPTTAEYVDGMRGVIERNTMRYFLGLESALTNAHLGKSTRFPAMANQWIDSVEHYPRQLHEMDRAKYLEMKLLEHGRP